MEKEFAYKFVNEWIEAWNSHDLDKIMSHYSDDFEMNSPVITQITNEQSGKLKGKNAVRSYWKKALSMNPSLHFEFIKCFLGANSMVKHYKGHRGLAAEIFIFNGEGKVTNAYAHHE